jgi:Holliday junction resolvase RusA-like endonuclease
MQVNKSDCEEGNFAVRVTVFGKPAPAGSKRAFYNAKLGRALVVDANANARPWKDSVTSAAVEAMDGARLLEGPLFLRVAFYQPRPKGHFNSKGELNAVGRRTPYPDKKPDCTKLVRGTEDAMTGVVYRDDAQIVHQIVTKHYGEPARAEIQVVRLSLEV